MRSPPFGACWLRVSKTPSHWGPKDVESWLRGQIFGSRKAEALENRVGCATRNEREKDRNWPPQRELDVHPPCFASEETEARSAKVTFRGMEIVHG